MNAYTLHRELDLLPANRMSNPAARPLTPHSSTEGLVGRLLARFAEFTHRRSVIGELNELSDRELADIGLTRTDVHHVFDAGFARGRA